MSVVRRAVTERYRGALAWAMAHRFVTVGAAVVVLAVVTRFAALHRHRVHAAA